MWELIKDLLLVSLGMGIGVVLMCIMSVGKEADRQMIELKESTRQDNARLFFDGKIDEVPTHAITMGISNILQAKKVLLVACGENKAQPIKVLVEGEKTTDVPASALQDHNDVVVIVDKAAASLLTK